MKRMYKNNEGMFVLEMDSMGLKKINGIEVARVYGKHCHDTVATWVSDHRLFELGVTRAEKTKRQGQLELNI